MGSVITVFVNRNFDNSLKVPASVQILKFSLFFLGNTQTPGFAQYQVE